MNLTVNGESQVPPGFRFHPTEEELLHYYLKKKVANQKIDLDVIQNVDLNKLEPWDIQGKCKIGSSAQNDWYFFSHKDKKYPTGTKTNRATIAGFWKATGRDKVIRSRSTRIGMRKTLVFYKGRAPHGEKSDWIIHEYRLDDGNINQNASSLNRGDQSEATEEGWVICRIFKKKIYVKSFDSRPTNSNNSLQVTTCQSHAHSLQKPMICTKCLLYMEKTNTTTTTTNTEKLVEERVLHLPRLETSNNRIIDPSPFDIQGRQGRSTLNWAEVDRLIAYQLNDEASYNSANHYNNTPFFLNDHNNGGSDEHTTGMPYNSETIDDAQLYHSTSSLLYPINQSSLPYSDVYVSEF